MGISRIGHSQQGIRQAMSNNITDQEKKTWRKSPTMNVKAMLQNPIKAYTENIYIAEQKFKGY